MPSSPPTMTRCHPFFDPVSRFTQSLPVEPGLGQRRWADQFQKWRFRLIKEHVEQNPQWARDKEIDWGCGPLTNGLLNEQVSQSFSEDDSRPAAEPAISRSPAMAAGTVLKPSVVYVDAQGLGVAEPGVPEPHEPASYNGVNQLQDIDPDRWQDQGHGITGSNITLRLPEAIQDDQVWISFLVSDQSLMRLCAIMGKKVGADQTVQDLFQQVHDIHQMLAQAIHDEWVLAEQVLTTLGDGEAPPAEDRRRYHELTQWWAGLPMVGGTATADNRHCDIQLPQAGAPEGYPLPPAYTTVVFVAGPIMPTSSP